jgi:hypothetical protein
MAERDRREYFASQVLWDIADKQTVEVLTEVSGIATRDAHCEAIKTRIENNRLAFEAAKALLDITAVAIEEIPAVLKAAEMAELAIAGGPAVAIIGGAGMALVMGVAACEAFNTCNGFPPVVVEAARMIMGETTSDKAAGMLQTIFGGDKSKWEPLFKALYSLVLPEGVITSLTSIKKPEPATPEGILISMGVIYGDYIIDAAIDYNKKALDCCGDDCESSVCQQAGRGCLLSTGKFWTATEGAGLNCMAT